MLVPVVVGCSVTDKTHAIGEIGKLLGAKWKELDDDEKKVYQLYLVVICVSNNCVSQPYLDQAAADKSRAEEEKNAYDVRTRVHQSFCPLLTFFRRARRPTAVAVTGTTTTSEHTPTPPVYMRSFLPVGFGTVIVCVWLLDTLPRVLARCPYITQNRRTLRPSLSMYCSSYFASRMASSAGACARRVRCITNDVL